MDTAFAGGPWSTEHSFVVADSDSDGLPDWWETAHGLNPGSATDVKLDSDGDGFTNAQEFAAGTDPLDPASAARITDTRNVGNDTLISFTTTPGKLYRVERSQISPTGPWTTISNSIPGTGSVLPVTDLNGGLITTAFYHVLTLP